MNQQCVNLATNLSITLAQMVSEFSVVCMALVTSYTPSRELGLSIIKQQQNKHDMHIDIKPHLYNAVQ